MFSRLRSCSIAKSKNYNHTNFILFFFCLFLGKSKFKFIQPKRFCRYVGWGKEEIQEQDNVPGGPCPRRTATRERKMTKEGKKMECEELSRNKILGHKLASIQYYYSQGAQ